jgi:hypothetical protein
MGCALTSNIVKLLMKRTSTCLAAVQAPRFPSVIILCCWMYLRYPPILPGTCWLAGLVDRSTVFH